MSDDIARITKKKALDGFFWFSMSLHICIIIGSSLWFYDLSKEKCEEMEDGTLWNEDGKFNLTCQCPSETLKKNDEYPVYCQLEACFTGLGIIINN